MSASPKRSRAGGIAQVLGLAEEFADDEAVIVILVDNIFQDSIREGKLNRRYAD
jgi:dTDP-glucose pyrophosphorylase